MSLRLALALLFLLLTCLGAESKVIEGVVQLTSLHSEVFLGKFSFSPKGGSVEGHLRVLQDDHPESDSKRNLALRQRPSASSVGQPRKNYLDDHPHELTILLFHGEAWKEYNRLLNEGSLCKERVAQASWKARIEPKHIRPGLTDVQEFNFKQHVTQYERTRYWYALISDCYLEEAPANPPPLQFRLTFLNNGKQLSADEESLFPVHVFLFLFLLGLGVLYLYLLRNMHRKFRQVHLVAVLLLLAFALQLWGVLCQIAHLYTYSQDGKGLRWRHTWFAMDFLSGLLQTASEQILSFTLIFVAFGWTVGGVNSKRWTPPTTLSSSSRHPDSSAHGTHHHLHHHQQQQHGMMNQSFVGSGSSSGSRHTGIDAQGGPRRLDFSAFAGCLDWLGRPYAVFGDTGAGGPPEIGQLAKAWDRPGSAPMFWWLLGNSFLQIFLEFMGRRYEEDFGSFHGLDHWPGRTRLVLRIVYVLVFLYGFQRSLPQLDPDSGMAKFLRRFRILGSLWFVCFPVLVLLAGLFIAPYHRHGLITGASLIGQSAALSLLCWTMLRPSSQFFRGSTLKQMGTVFGGVTGFRGGKLAVD